QAAMRQAGAAVDDQPLAVRTAMGNRVAHAREAVFLGRMTRVELDDSGYAAHEADLSGSWVQGAGSRNPIATANTSCLRAFVANPTAAYGLFTLHEHGTLVDANRLARAFEQQSGRQTVFVVDQPHRRRRGQSLRVGQQQRQ